MFEEYADKLKSGLSELKIDESRAELLLAYLEELYAFNQITNVTAVREPEAMVRELILNSLSALPVTKLGSVNRFIDVGTGGGLPGLPLLFAVPGLEGTLIDSVGKKTDFVYSVAQKLGITDRCEVIKVRAEDLAFDPEYREYYDAAVSRAVAELRTLCEYTLPFVKPGGCLYAWKGPLAQEEVKAAAHAIGELGGRCDGIIPAPVPGSDRENNIVIIRKVGKTPIKYPRRAGKPVKEPL